MNELLFNLAACLGALLAMLGAAIQLGLDLGVAGHDVVVTDRG